MLGNNPPDLGVVHLVQLLVVVIEDRDILHPEYRCGGAQFALANRCQRGAARVSRVSRSMLSVPSCISSRRGKKKRLHALARVLRKRPARAERFVIRVREHG